MIPPVIIVDYINLFDIYPKSIKDEAKIKDVCAQVKAKFNELNIQVVYAKSV